MNDNTPYLTDSAVVYLEETQIDIAFPADSCLHQFTFSAGDDDGTSPNNQFAFYLLSLLQNVHLFIHFTLLFSRC